MLRCISIFLTFLLFLLVGVFPVSASLVEKQGRPASITYSGTGGGTVNYTSHDNNGNLLSLNENGANPITRTYDGLNRVTSYTSGGQTIGYRYYPSGKLAKLIYPGGNENGTGHVEYTYDSHGRLYQVIDKLDSTTHSGTDGGMSSPVFIRTLKDTDHPHPVLTWRARSSTAMPSALPLTRRKPPRKHF